MWTPRNVALTVAALIVGAVGYWYFAGAAPIANYGSDGTDIIAFGDSLVVGVGSTPGHDFVSLVSEKVGEPIINLGRSGETSAGGLARIRELDQYHPKVVMLLLGGNDYLRRVPPEETFANLGAIIKDVQARGAIVLLIGVRGGLLSDKYAAEYKKLSKTYHTAYVHDALSGLFGHTDLMSDQIHPNDAGYAIIANRVAPVLMPLLQ